MTVVSDQCICGGLHLNGAPTGAYDALTDADRRAIVIGRAAAEWPWSTLKLAATIVSRAVRDDRQIGPKTAGALAEFFLALDIAPVEADMEGIGL